jgi:hypothetical protein
MPMPPTWAARASLRKRLREGLRRWGGGLLMLLVMMPSADGVSPEVVSVEVQGGDDIEILNRG